MMPFAPHKSRIRVGLEHPPSGADVPPAEVPVQGEPGLTIRFVEVRPTEALVPGEEFLVAVRSPAGHAHQLLEAVLGSAAFSLGHEAVYSADGVQGAQVFLVVLPSVGTLISQALSEAGGPGDEWTILRSDYAHVLMQTPQILSAAAEHTGEAMGALAGKLGELAGRIVAGAGKGLGLGTIALAVGAAAIGLAIYYKVAT